MVAFTITEFVTGVTEVPERDFLIMAIDLLEKFSEIHGKQETKQEECLELFDKAIMALNEKYLPGTYDYISQNRKVLWQSLEKLEAELHKAWSGDVQVFREVLTRYYRATLDCIRVYREVRGRED